MSADIVNVVSKQSDDGLISRKTLAQKLDVSLRQVDYWLARGMIPHRRKGRIVRFDLQEVVDSFTKCVVKCSVKNY